MSDKQGENVQVLPKAREHVLKCWPPYFDAVLNGSKPFELRHNDRDFRMGDTLLLREWCPDNAVYTGREVRKLVTYMIHGGAFGLQADFVIMGLARATGPTP